MADFVDEIFKAEGAEEQPAPPVEAPVEQPVEAQPQPEPEAAPAPEPAAEPAKDEQRTVPLATFLDTRDELREAKRWREDRERRDREAQTRLDPRDDPEGFAAQQHQLVEQRLTQERFAMSDMFARQTHGTETVDAATAWAQGRAQSDPAFAMAYMRQQNPIDWIVQQHKRDALLADIGDPSKLDDWFSREAQKRGYVMQSAPAAVAAPAAAVVPPAPKPAQPPRSIASDSGKGPSATPDDARAEFLSIFEHKAA